MSAGASTEHIGRPFQYDISCHCLNCIAAYPRCQRCGRRGGKVIAFELESGGLVRQFICPYRAQHKPRAQVRRLVGYPNPKKNRYRKRRSCGISPLDAAVFLITGFGLFKLFKS